MIVTLKGSVGRNRSVNYRGIRMDYSKIAPSLFFGFERRERYDLATAEKAPLDLLYLRGTLPVSDELELGELDSGRLLDFSKKYPGTVRKKIENLIRQDKGGR
jgi:hypothetical protein